MGLTGTWVVRGYSGLRLTEFIQVSLTIIYRVEIFLLTGGTHNSQ